MGKQVSGPPPRNTAADRPRGDGDR